MDDFDLDALLVPGNSFASMPAKAGYPSICVPGPLVPNTASNLPDGFNAKPGPYGITFSGKAWSEPKLIAIAYAFEQATKYRVPPFSTPALPKDSKGNTK
jgi:amidase